MAALGSDLVVFLLTALMQGRYINVNWVNQGKHTFEVLTCHKKRKDYDENYKKVFVDWASKRSKKIKRNHNKSRSNPQGGFFAAMNRSRFITELNPYRGKNRRVYELETCVKYKVYNDCLVIKIFYSTTNKWIATEYSLREEISIYSDEEMDQNQVPIQSPTIEEEEQNPIGIPDLNLAIIQDLESENGTDISMSSPTKDNKESINFDVLDRIVRENELELEDIDKLLNDYGRDLFDTGIVSPSFSDPMYANNTNEDPMNTVGLSDSWCVLPEIKAETGEQEYGLGLDDDMEDKSFDDLNFFESVQPLQPDNLAVCSGNSGCDASGGVLEFAQGRDNSAVDCGNDWLNANGEIYKRFIDVNGERCQYVCDEQGNRFSVVITKME